MVKNIFSASHTLRALTLLLLSVCAFHGAWADDKLTNDPVGNVVFRIPEGMVNGASDDMNGSYSVTPSRQSGVRSFVIPTNYTFFRNKDKDGYASTLQYWVEENGDTTVHYVPGHSYTFASEGQTLTLVPVFKDNPASAVNRTKVTVMRFDFTRKLHDYDDSNTNQRRKVCAPPVDFGSGVKPFWTTKVYVSVLEDGEDKSHERDVALWCDTGKKGYIRNTKLEEWCAFGPGTTFWVPGGVGTTISMLTYSKISSTTFDGVVPKLDEEQTRKEREKAGHDKVYVYTHTTNNPDLRVPIVIGEDDYSYYHWIEVRTAPANMVELHATVHDPEHGVITKAESASGNFEVKKLEDGGYAFKKGDRVRLTLNRRFGYELDRIVDLDRTGKDGNPLTVVKKNNDGTANLLADAKDSQATTFEKNADGSWGNDQTVFTLKQTEPTEEELADSLYTRYEVEFNITDHCNLMVYFKEKATYYVTYSGGKMAMGTPPSYELVEEGDAFVIPTNRTLFFKGYTLDHWEDELRNVYNIGSVYIAPSSDLHLTPVFLPNQFNRLDVTEDVTATWDFAPNKGAPTVDLEKAHGILVTQLKWNNKAIDIKIDLNATKGKFTNINKTHPERMQITAGAVIEFPATAGCLAKLTLTENIKKGNKTVKIEGKSLSLVNNMEPQTVCQADTAYLNVEFVSGSYFSHFSVTYKPQTVKKPTIATLSCDGKTLSAEQIKEQMANNGYIAFDASPWKNTDEEMPEVTGTATGDGIVTATKADITTQECIVTVMTHSSIAVESYPVKFNMTKPDTPPVFTTVTVGGKEYTGTSNEIYDVPRSGVIKVGFNRTMKQTLVFVNGTVYIPESGKELVFRYWDMAAGDVVKLKMPAGTFKDIYGAAYEQALSLTLHITEEKEKYHRHLFNYVVGRDGDINQAIVAANENVNIDGHRFYIFVPDGTHHLTGNAYSYIAGVGNINNGVTQINASNVSLIGQSKEGAVIYNEPKYGGSACTSTIALNSGVNDFYAEEITMDNRFDYVKAKDEKLNTQAIAFRDRGDRTVLKNVSLKSYEYTYNSSNPSASSRGYFENCDITGAVDMVMGDGNIWFEECNLILRDRSANNIAAPTTQPVQEWGYVFNNCTIKPEADQLTMLKDENWTLGRPGNYSPACTFLNTRMLIEPRPYGWTKKKTGLKVRFHENNSMNAAGNKLSLGARTIAVCAPAAGSDECVLSDAEAASYNVRNVLGGDDGFKPDELCCQIDAASADDEDKDANSLTWTDNISIEDDRLTWDDEGKAMCYFVFKQNEETGKWTFVDNITTNSYDLSKCESGYYCVRAANMRGGLGAATKSVWYEKLEPYVLTIHQTGDETVDGKPYGWSTICLPFNARVPEEVKVYAATAHNSQSADDKVNDYIMTLTQVMVTDSLKGYVVYGPAGDHSFSPTSQTSGKPTILEGNATDSPLSALNIPCYVLSNKTWGLGFYKFTGSYLAAHRAWLPQSVVTDQVNSGLAASSRAIRFEIDNATAISPIRYDKPDNTVYNLSGQRVNGNTPRGVYIIGKRKVVMNR